MWWQGRKERGARQTDKWICQEKVYREKQDGGDGEGLLIWGVWRAYHFPRHVREGDSEQSPGERDEWMRGVWKE